ncbi:hypothetical protein HKK55_04265 [Pseudomonas sp. ADAK18]|uniref:DUF6124 family protein n=1 Tax=Pseudomonas sp. ADAK18 TaxID=2730848 RepID=UPI00146316CE|nr:DUF6124 family protein [Pseudomonas sp. ADAK18]QJI27954.1 hypothetical protein HKK55_04265 [Pseudomonas sp. ADAK18]
MIKPTPNPPLNADTLRKAANRALDFHLQPSNHPPIKMFTVTDGIGTEDLLVNLSETLASANALICDLAFELEGSRRERALGIAQLIELARLQADRVLEGVEQSTSMHA